MVSSKQILHLNPAELKCDPENIRQDGDDPELPGLARSLADYGVLQPLGVQRTNGAFRVVFGDRRRRAALLAGLETVPCVEVGDGDLLVQQVIENVQRRPLNPIDQAEAFARLRRQAERAGKQGAAAEAEVAERLGLSAATIRRYLALRELAPEVRDRLREEELTPTQAQHLRAIRDPDAQAALARLAVERGLSARQVRVAATALANRPGLSPEAAANLAERGEAAPPPAAAAPREKPQALPARPEAEEDPDTELWPEEIASEEEESPFGAAPATADGHRVFRLRSIDAFCDEVARLARAVQEGDLAQAAAGDPASPLKLRLAARQLEFIRRALRQLLGDD